MKYESDVTLIDAMLALTPEERIDQNDRMLRTIEELHDGFARSQEPDQLVLLVLEDTLRRATEPHDS